MITTTVIILCITILFFVWGKFTPDIVALLSMIALFLTGVITLPEAFSGFSNKTVVMIAALFILGDSLAHTGWTALAGKYIIKWAGSSSTKLILITTLGSGVLSGFVSNTGTVATLLPVTISSAWNIGIFPSKVLIPVAFGSNTGGLLTLTGTPPNIIASGMLEEAGYEGLSFFEIGMIGLPLLILALIYFRFIGQKILPSYKTKNRPVDIDSTLHEWIDNYKIDESHYRLRIRSLSPLINTKIGDWNFENTYNVSIIRLKRRHPNVLKGTQPYIELPTDNVEMRYHDVITVKGDTKDINRLMIKYRLGLWTNKETPSEELREDLINHEVGMTEIIVTPKSMLVGRRFKMGSFFDRFQIQMLAASRNNKPLTDQEIVVKAGDAFLVRGTWNAIEKLKEQYKNLVLIGSTDGMVKNIDKLNYKSYISLGALVLMIVLLVLKLLPAAMAAVICSGIVLLTGCVPINKAYKSISWGSVIMIAAMIPMGVALQKTGTAKLIADQLVAFLGDLNPVVLLGGVFVLTTAFSQVISNSATALLMAPIVLSTASSLGISPTPFMVVVAISASTAFLTPIGTTTNAMVMTAGGYKFKDYFIVGAPLLLMFLVVSLLLVPLIWPF